MKRFKTFGTGKKKDVVGEFVRTMVVELASLLGFL